MPTSAEFLRTKLILIPFLLFFFANQAQAGVFRQWEDIEITDIKEKVSDIFGKTGPVHSRVVAMKPILDNLNPNAAGTFAERLKNQLAELNDKGQLAKESLKDILVWIKTRQGPYVEFVGDLNDKCNPASPCAQFREDLRNFVRDISVLSDRFPIIQKTGLDKADDIIEKFIDLPPHIIMWGFHELWQRIPQLKELPTELELIYEELNDADIFSVEFANTHQTLRAMPTIVPAGFMRIATTSDFCSRQINNSNRGLASWDPLRLNRLLWVLKQFEMMVGAALDILHDDLNLSLVGEGSAVPSPIGVYLAIIKYIVESIELGIETRLKNVELCNNLSGSSNGNGGGNTNSGGGNGNNGNGGNNGNNGNNPVHFLPGGGIQAQQQLAYLNRVGHELSGPVSSAAPGQLAENHRNRQLSYLNQVEHNLSGAGSSAVYGQVANRLIKHSSN